MEEPLELVAIVYSQDERALLTSRLEWDGIRCFSHGERHIGVDAALTVALGGVRLFVFRDDAPAARSLLADIGQWDRQPGVYDNSRVIDWLIALCLLVLISVPPPARIPSVRIAAAETVSD